MKTNDILYAVRLPAPQRYRVIYSALKRAESKKVRNKKTIKKKQINPKHQFIKELLELGLNPRQAASLKQNSVDFTKNIIKIDKKLLPLSEDLKRKFREHCDFSKIYLFQTNRGRKYTTRTVQEIAKFTLC